MFGHSFRLLSHGVFLSAWLYNFMYLFIHGLTDTYGGRKKFLTYLNTTSLVIYTGFSFLTNIIKNKKLTKLRDYYFASIVFPFSSLVTVLFWVLFAINEDLVFPKALVGKVPKHGWYNHTVHSGPLLFAILDMIFTVHIYPTKLKGMCLTAGAGISYIVWILWIAYKSNIWVYPILEKLSPVQLAIFLAGDTVLTSSLYLAGSYINGVLRQKERSLVNTEKEE